jgi:hypothetical protein
MVGAEQNTCCASSWEHAFPLLTSVTSKGSNRRILANAYLLLIRQCDLVWRLVPFQGFALQEYGTLSVVLVRMPVGCISSVRLQPIAIDR